MSCDHAVWFPSRRLSNQEAGALYARLCEGDSSGVVPSGAIDAFYSELVAKHPQIDDIPEDRVDDSDYCPWSIAFDRSPGHLIMCCVWSKADYVSALLKSLARKHGLALYDPQSERVWYPDDSDSGPSQKPRWKFW
jgi:hypothetical protein